MRIGKRRDFLKTMGLAVGSLQLLSIPEFVFAASSKPAAKPLEFKEFIGSFHSWYCKTHFDFDKAFTAEEKSYLKTCTENLNASFKNLNEQVMLSTITYSHRVKGEKVNSSRVGYGTFDRDDAAQKMAREIYKKRGLAAKDLNDNGQVIGLGWDFEADNFKVYFYEEDLAKVTDPKMKELLAKTKGQELYPFGMRSYSFKGKRLEESRLYVPLKQAHAKGELEKLPALKTFKDQIQHVNLMITDKRGLVPQIDMKTQADSKAFNKAGQTLLAQYQQQFGVKVDTLAYNSQDEFTLYYP